VQYILAMEQTKPAPLACLRDIETAKHGVMIYKLELT